MTRLFSGEFLLKTYCLSVLHKIRCALRRSFWHPSWAVHSLPWTLSGVECLQMKSTNRNDSSWYSSWFHAVQLPWIAVIFRQYEGVLFWPPVNEYEKWDCFAHVRMKLSFVSWAHSLFFCRSSWTYRITQEGCVARLVMCPFAHSCWSLVAVGHSASEEEGMLLSKQGVFCCFPEGQWNHFVHEGNE